MLNIGWPFQWRTSMFSKSLRENTPNDLFLLTWSIPVAPGASDVPQGEKMSTPNQSSHQAGFSTPEKRISEKAIKSASFSWRKMERRACDSEFKHRKNSGYGVKIVGLLLFEEEEEEASSPGTNEIISFETCRIPILRTFSLLLESVFVLVWISCKCAWKSSFVIYIYCFFFLMKVMHFSFSWLLDCHLLHAILFTRLFCSKFF